MQISSDYVDLLSALNDERAEYLVVGAYAVAYHARPRYTKDLDLWIRNDLEALVIVSAAVFLERGGRSDDQGQLLKPRASMCPASSLAEPHAGWCPFKVSPGWQREWCGDRIAEVTLTRALGWTERTAPVRNDNSHWPHCDHELWPHLWSV
ncbi:MAG: hypothetical protein AMXMBFR64_42820 [Myxococcales bacterium]